MVSATRPAIETLLRRLVIGRKQYPGIQQISGIVVGFDKDPDNPSRLNKVFVRQNNDEMVVIPAALILGEPAPLPLPTRINMAIRRLHWAGQRQYQDDPRIRLWSNGWKYGNQ